MIVDDFRTLAYPTKSRQSCKNSALLNSCLWMEEPWDSLEDQFGESWCMLENKSESWNSPSKYGLPPLRGAVGRFLSLKLPSVHFMLSWRHWSHVQEFQEHLFDVFWRILIPYWFSKIYPIRFSGRDWSHTQDFGEIKSWTFGILGTHLLQTLQNVRDPILLIFVFSYNL